MDCCCCKRKKKRNIILLLVGLDNAGKTATVRGLARQPSENTLPTVGFSVVQIKYRNHSVKIFDLGGGPSIRGIWHKYFADAYGIIFVIDASDVQRLEEVRQILFNLCSHEKITGKPILILGNKCDNEGSLDEIDLIEQLQIEKAVNQNQCPTLVQSCTALSRDMDMGIKHGCEWILDYIISNYDSINARVHDDIAHQTLLEANVRREIMERMARERNQNDSDVDAIESYSMYERQLNGTDRSLTNLSTGNESVETCLFRLERPSSVRLVREYLVKNGTSNGHFWTKRPNKVAPMEVRSNSARSSHEKRMEYDRQRRLLKSADGKMSTPQIHTHMHQTFRIRSDRN